MTRAWSPRRFRQLAAAVATPFGAVAELYRQRRRLLTFILGALIVIGVTSLLALSAVSFVIAPAAAPVAAAGAVMGDVADLFGDGGSDEALSAQALEEVRASGQVECQIPADPTPTSLPAPVGDPEAPGPQEAAEAAAPVPAVLPLPVNADGSVSRADAETLVAPLQPGMSTLTAHVWFLYRMAGIGDWEAFSDAYHRAGLRGDDTEPNAALRQVQALNASGVDVSRYRLPAAALAAVGSYRGMLSDPYPDYRGVLTEEIAAVCLPESGASAAPLPPAMTTVPALPGPPDEDPAAVVEGDAEPPALEVP